MFDSVEGGIVPVCVLAAVAAVVLSKVRSAWLASMSAAAVAVAIGYVWVWLPYVLAPRHGGDPLRPWDLVATAYWSLFAVPVAIVVLFITRRLRKARAHAS